MGISSSSLLDESKSNFVRGQAGAVLKEFSAYYKRQYLVAFFSKVQDEVEQKKTGQTQLLKQREPPKPSDILYEENVLFFDDTRKWKVRFVVVRANYSLECHDSYETFVKGVKPRYKLLPTGGTVLTSEEKYMVLVDKLCPDLNNTKEEFAPPMVTMPGQFPVYLRLPYRRDSYFCFQQEARRTRFISILNDCIRHQNQDFLRKTACEVQAFQKAIRFYRQEKGCYVSWDMLIGSDVRVLSNLVMEKLLPPLQTEMLPRLKGRKTDRKKAWFATVEAAYILVQEELLKGLSEVKQECRATAKQQEALIRSNMDQIITSRDFVVGKLRALVTEPAAKFCSEHVQPHLAPVLEEVMGPISAGFQEMRALCERQMSQMCQDFQESRSTEELKQALEQLRKVDLQSCYTHIDVLQDHLQELQGQYNFANCTGLVHRTQIDMQQLMRNAAYTFEQLLVSTLKDNPASLGSAMEKAKLRVLKQYDYDSSTTRKRIFQEALLDMTLPVVKKNLAPTCKPELQAFDQYIFADYSNFIQVENVYEDILLQTLECEISKVVNEAASLKKHNLFVDGTHVHLTSQSSLSEGPTPPGSLPASPAKSIQSLTPDSPLAGNGQPVVPEQRNASGVTEKELAENAEKLDTTQTVNGATNITPDTEETSPSTAVVDKQVTSSTPEAEEIIPNNAKADKQVTSSTPEAEEIIPNNAEADKQVTSSTPEAEITHSTPEAEKQVPSSTPEAEVTPSTPEAEKQVTSSTPEAEKQVTTSTPEAEKQVASSTPEAEKQVTTSTPEAEKQVASSTPEAEKQVTTSTPEAERQVPSSTPEAERQIPSSTPEAEKQVPSSTPEADKQVTPSPPEAEGITTSTAEVDKQVTSSTHEAAEITPSTSEADKQVTPEAQTVILPNPPESVIGIMPGMPEIVKELTPSTAETEQESEPTTAEAEKGSTPSGDKTEDSANSVTQVEKENAPSVTETEEDAPSATEAEEGTPFAAELMDKDVICAAEAEQEAVPSVSETTAETPETAASLQSVAPGPSPSTDSAVEQDPDVEGMVTSISNPPLAEAGSGTVSPTVLVIDKAEENEGGDAVSDASAPSTGCSKADGPEISVSSPEVDGDTGALSGEGSEGDDTASSDPSEEVTESDVSLTPVPTAEGPCDNAETPDAGPVSEDVETEVSGDPVPTEEEADDSAALPTAAVSPRVSSPAEGNPAEEPGPAKAQALDCVKEIRDLVVEVIEVEEVVQRYPDGSSS